MPLTELDAPGATPEARARRDHSFASPSLAVHLRRGLIGFGAVAVAWYLWPRLDLLALVPATLGVVALRGCPTCWTIGLAQTLSRRRFERACSAAGCRLVDNRPRPDEGVDTVRA